MSSTTLLRLARRATRQRALEAALTGAGIGAGAGVLGALVSGRFGWPAAAGIAACAGALVAVARALRAPVSEGAIAAHLDRTVPALEESASLLVADPDRLAPLALLQRERVAQALDRMADPAATIPHRWRRAAARGLAGLAIAAALGVALPRLAALGRPTAAHRSPVDGSLAPPRAAAPIAIVASRLAVRPPAYTGHAPRESPALDAAVEQDAGLHWRVDTDRPMRAAWLVGGRDSVAFSVNGARAVLAQGAEASLVYAITVVAEDGTTARTPFHRLDVVPDAEPLLTVVRPDGRVTVGRGEPPVVDVELLAIDDYGVVRSALVATVAKGSGEGVKFREDTLRFDAEERRPGGGLLLRRRFDLAALGMAPGDELYFHAVAWDNRRPAPNLGRSETVFVTWADTSSVTVATAAPMAISLVPEYFRSQRQIIIDTERLLAERSRLSESRFRERADEIGVDQKLLRLRYGQFLGEEFESSLGGGEPAHAGEEPDANHGDESADPAAGLVHRHDTAENATLFAPSTRDQLKRALAQMWEAELRLRTARPREALPYEQRALELLKDVQQRDRAYVRRVGFEPPPLEPDKKRLTGKLDGIAGQRVTLPPPDDGDDAALRAGLAAVRRLRAGQATPRDAGILEQAGRDLARRLLERPGADLAPLAALRAILDSTAAGRPPDAQHVVAGEAALWGALPRAEARATRRAAPSAAVEAFRRLGT